MRPQSRARSTPASHAGATPRAFGDPNLVDETLAQIDPDVIARGDVVGIGIHTGNALRGYEVIRLTSTPEHAAERQRGERKSVTEMAPRTTMPGRFDKFQP